MIHDYKDNKPNDNLLIIDFLRRMVLFEEQIKQYEEDETVSVK
jgi:hypothetical protein